MISTSVKELNLLQEAVEKGIIDITKVNREMQMIKEKEILAAHPHKIWQGVNGLYYTYIDEDGKRKLKKRTSREAIEKLIIEEYETREKNKAYIFSSEFEAWIKKKEEWKELDDSTIIRYKSDYKRFFKGSVIDSLDVSEFNDFLLEDFIKKSIKEKALTAKSYQNLKIILNGVLKYSKKTHHTDFSIGTFFRDLEISDKTFKKKSKNSAYIYSKNERKRLYEYFVEHESMPHLALALQCLTGLRIGELSTLKFSDLVGEDRLYIHRTEIKVLNEDGTQSRGVKEEAKQGHDGLIFIPKDAYKIIVRAKELSGRQVYLFSENGKRITSRQLNYRLQKACEAIGIEYRSSHKMRKTYASILLSNKIDETIVQGQMRHKDILTTRQYYYFNVEDEQKEKVIIENAVVIK